MRTSSHLALNCNTMKLMDTFHINIVDINYAYKENVEICV